MALTSHHRALAPAPPRALPLIYRPRVTFYDLPAELRIEIYKLCLVDVTIKIAQPQAADGQRPHPLTRTSHQIRTEVLPMIHAICPIRCDVHNFNFEGLLLWLSRIPPDQESNLCKNTQLRIRLSTNEMPKGLDSLRKWLHRRADPHRPQPNWQYYGPKPGAKICADMRRRAKRMREVGKQEELLGMLVSVGVSMGDGLSHHHRRIRGS